MRRRVEIWLGILSLVFAGVADAGVVSLTNGTTFQGTPTGELILVSTGKDLLEFTPESILSLKAGEIRLKDGRVIAGTVVGGRLRFKTDLGEVAVALTDLKEYRETVSSPPISPRPQEPMASSPPAPRPASPPVVTAPAPPVVPPTAGPLESQPPPAASSSAPPTATVRPPSPLPTAPPTGQRTFRVVVTEAGLYSEATVQAQRVGFVRRGEILGYVDMIDRRVSVFGYVVDWGNWIKVRARSGLLGWVEAEMLQEVREGISAQWMTP